MPSDRLCNSSFTKTLLGHKSQAMTDKYHDDRGKNWQVQVIVIK